MRKLINLTSLSGTCVPGELHTRLASERGSWGGGGAPLCPSPESQGGTKNNLKIERKGNFSSHRGFCWFSLLKNYLNISNVIPSHT